MEGFVFLFRDEVFFVNSKCKKRNKKDALKILDYLCENQICSKNENNLKYILERLERGVARISDDSKYWFFNSENAGIYENIENVIIL